MVAGKGKGWHEIREKSEAIETGRTWKEVGFMPGSRYHILTRTALLLALTLLFQSLRLVIPLPVLMSTFFIGTMVNACLLIAAEMVGWRSALFISIMAPIVAYMQQLLPIPLFILPVFAGNAIYVILFLTIFRRGRYPAVLTAGLGKTFVLYGCFYWMLTWIDIPRPVAAGLLFVMSWPQLVTTIAGGLLAAIIVKRVGAGR
jgi:hypothetical protein